MSWWLWLLIALALGVVLLVISSLPSLARYLRIKRM
ncbi:MAG: DUF6893 family small protein [Gemmatimonadaceae bacterium]